VCESVERGNVEPCFQVGESTIIMSSMFWRVTVLGSVGKLALRCLEMCLVSNFGSFPRGKIQSYIFTKWKDPKLDTWIFPQKDLSQRSSSKVRGRIRFLKFAF